jgi:hypothetical protein
VREVQDATKGINNVSNLWEPEKVPKVYIRQVTFRRLRSLPQQVPAATACQRAPTTAHPCRSNSRCGRASDLPLPGWCADCTFLQLRPSAHCGHGPFQSPLHGNAAASALLRAPNESSTLGMPFRTCICGRHNSTVRLDGQRTDRHDPTPKYGGKTVISQSLSQSRRRVCSLGLFFAKNVSETISANDSATLNPCPRYALDWLCEGFPPGGTLAKML